MKRVLGRRWTQAPGQRFHATSILVVLVAALAVVGFVAPTGATLAQDEDAGITSVEFEDGVDRDGDGYYAKFAVAIEADTKCWGCYDKRGWFGGNPEMEPVFLLFIEDSRIGRRNVEREERLIERWETNEEWDEMFSRRELTIRLQLWDDDVPPPDRGILNEGTDDLIDEWEGTIAFEPSSEDERNEPPAAAFAVSPSEPAAGTEVTLAASASTDPDGSIDSFEWSLDTRSRSGERVTHVFESPGNYSVALTVTDDGGATDTAERTIRVRRSANETTENETGASELVLDAAATVEDRDVTATYQLTNHANVSLAGVQLRLGGIPENWTVVDHADANGTWVSEETMWFWQTIEPNGSENPSATIRVPADAPSGNHTLTAVALDADGRTDAANTTITVSNGSLIVQPRGGASETPNGTASSIGPSGELRGGATTLRGVSADGPEIEGDRGSARRSTCRDCHV